MGDGYDWLPDLIVFSGKGFEIGEYFDFLYDYFKKDFIDEEPILKAKRVKIRSMPPSEGKEGMFWYLTHDHPHGYTRDERWIPNLRRCERIRWIRALIEALEYGAEEVVYWYKQFGREQRLHIALEDFSYFVVLTERESYFVLWTAFPADRRTTVDRKRREYGEYWKSKRRP